uniref:Immunoglobulin C1-set domain-containing protein n=1 Tax=Equus asinus TaxID=9793 RepID=A0A8C4MLR8_EQUAS
DIHLPVDIFPKPIVFFPSIAEINLHKTGTYFCLLDKFFPDVIKVYWKEKNGNTILVSQQGNTMKTNDTYMKFSWLTVTENSMDKEHKCIIKHENNKGGVDQEILFPSPHFLFIFPSDKYPLQLQLTSTSAYYTYLLLLASAVCFTIINFRLCRRTVDCGNGKSS